MQGAFNYDCKGITLARRFMALRTVEVLKLADAR
jgi:hypothetical protein